MKKRSIRSVAVLSRCLEPLEGRVMLAADHLAFITQPTDTTAGGTIDPAITVAVEDSSNKVVTGDSSSVTISIKTLTGPASATLGGTLTIAAVKGIATFSDLSLTAASGNHPYCATANDGGLTAANSSNFNVNAGAPTQLVFDTQPSAAKAGAADTAAVDVEDKYGNLVIADSSNITLSIASGPSHTPPPAKPGSKVSDTPIPATLGGTVTVPTDTGVATFSDLTLDFAGAYTLTASDATLTKAISNSFSITAGTAAQVAFGTPPASGAAGALPSITAELKIRLAMSSPPTRRPWRSPSRPARPARASPAQRGRRQPPASRRSATWCSSIAALTRW